MSYHKAVNQICGQIKRCTITRQQILMLRVKEALAIPEWKEAIPEEMRTLEKNSTWEKVDLPKRKSTVWCKWVFTTKYNSDGSLERYRARLVAKGFTQTHEVDYSENSSPGKMECYSSYIIYCCES